uniref:Putative monooxygenase p33MONOX n=1 Tax=Nothobranchius rachovii TaxID=451742 RepID=A0A1A8SHK1_9TELE
MPSGLCGVLSCPIGIMRHNISYDEHIDIPMHSPPADMTVNVFWKDHPIVPQHRFRNTVEVSENGDKLQTQEAQTQPKSPTPAVKAKATTLSSSSEKDQSQSSYQNKTHFSDFTDGIGI